MGFEKKKEIDRSDFTKLVDILDTDKFGRELWGRLVEQTEILMNDKKQFDLHQINLVLAKYAKYHGWIIIESERFNEMVEKTNVAFEQWYQGKYAVASRNVAKNTAANIEAKVVEMCKQEYQEDLAELIEEQNMEPQEAQSKLKYSSLSGKRNYIIELKTKANMIKGFVKVWEKEISALQTLSKNVQADIGFAQNKNLE